MAPQYKFLNLPTSRILSVSGLQMIVIAYMRSQTMQAVMLSMQYCVVTYSIFRKRRRMTSLMLLLINESKILNIIINASVLKLFVDVTGIAFFYLHAV